jgi:hypothetical protein
MIPNLDRAMTSSVMNHNRDPDNRHCEIMQRGNIFRNQHVLCATYVATTYHNHIGQQPDPLRSRKVSSLLRTRNVSPEERSVNSPSIM